MKLEEIQYHFAQSAFQRVFRVSDIHKSLFINHLISSRTRVLCSILVIVLFVHYAAQYVIFHSTSKNSSRFKDIPTIPHFIPFLGSIPFTYLWNPLEFVKSSKDWFWRNSPVRVRLVWGEYYIIQGVQCIRDVFRNSKFSAATAEHGFFLRDVFNMPKEAALLYELDDSGDLHTPHSESNVAPKNRVDFRVHQTLTRFLGKPVLGPFSDRFNENITKRLCNLPMGHQWEKWSDFMYFFHRELMSSSTDALCGTSLLRRNPDFVRDFWELDQNMGIIIKRIPRIFAPKVYAIRDKLLNAIKDWHAYARANFDPSQIGPDGDDPYWGSKFFRDRQEMFLEMDGFNFDAIASSDFGFIWAAHTNAPIAAFWMAIDLFQNPRILEQARKEAETCIVTEKVQESGMIRFDVDRLMQQPMLQAVYAETLRLRVHAFIVRCPGKEDFTIKDWTIPRNNIMAICTTPPHMDGDFWSSTQFDGKSVDNFWPERFLRLREKGVGGGHQFCADGTDGFWIPYGGGRRKCPGRYMAKKEIILMAALMICLFDCEVLASERALQMDPKGMGLGVLSPKAKVPVRIRRRKSSEGAIP